MAQEKLQVREAILTSVNTRQGITGVNLVLNVMGMTNPQTFDDKEYNHELEELVNSGEIVELEYTLAAMDYRVKSIYFPKGTIIHAPRETNDSHHAESNSIR